MSGVLPAYVAKSNTKHPLSLLPKPHKCQWEGSGHHTTAQRGQNTKGMLALQASRGDGII